MSKYTEQKKTIDLRILSYAHSYLSDMTNALAKFQKEPYKTVGAVAYTRYRLYIDIDSIECLSPHPGEK